MVFFTEHEAQFFLIVAGDRGKYSDFRKCPNLTVWIFSFSMVTRYSRLPVSHHLWKKNVQQQTFN